MFLKLYIQNLSAFRYVANTDEFAVLMEESQRIKDVLNHQNLFSAHNADPHNMRTKLLTILGSRAGKYTPVKCTCNEASQPHKKSVP